MRGLKKLKVEVGHPRGVYNFCLEKGTTYRLRSSHRSYRFLNACPKCLKNIRRGFRKRSY